MHPKRSPSTANISVLEKAREGLALFRSHRAATSGRIDFDWVFDDIQAYDRLLREHGALPLADARVLEIGYGARPHRLLALLSMGVDAEGVDAEVPILSGSASEFTAAYRTNGLERVLKSAVRYMLFDTRERRQFTDALQARGLQPNVEPSRFRVAEAASFEADRGYDLIISEDVFEHIPEESLRVLVPKLARWLNPGGLALIRPNIFTGITGGHAIDWSPQSFRSPMPRRRTEPWEHLRRGDHRPNTYLNRLTREQYRELFATTFSILEETVALPDLGREFLDDRAAQELAGWSDQELFSNQVRFILHPMPERGAPRADARGPKNAQRPPRHASDCTATVRRSVTGPWALGEDLSTRTAEDTTSLEQVLRLIRHRWWIVVVCTAIAGVAAFGFSLAQRKQYTASASLLFRDPGFDRIVFGASFFGQTVDPQREAATNVRLVSLPEVAARTSTALHGSLTSGQVASEVSVVSQGQSDVASVSVTDPVPARAAVIANTYAHQYVLFRQQADRAKIFGAQRPIQQQLARLNPAQRNGAIGQSLLNRANQLRVLASLQTGNAELVQLAATPHSPTSPRTKRNTLLGAFLGLVLGLAIASLLERLDRRLRDPSELEEAFGVPVLGAVPDSPAYGSARTTDPLPAAEAEAFNLLRARLRYFNVDRVLRSLLITSALPGDGKSTTAVNLAVAEGSAGSARVVLVEADLRRPTLAQRLGIKARPGLAEVISRNATLENALQRVPVAGHSNGSRADAHFHVLVAGAIPPNPAELIESESMTQLLATLSEQFDLVILDSPPVSVVSDAIPLMRKVSGVVVVSRIGQTTRDAARHLSEQLSKLGAPTLGVVANAVPAKSRGYGYGYYGTSYDDSAKDPANIGSSKPNSVEDDSAPTEVRVGGESGRSDN